jgi:hypothetical protein
MPSTLDTVRDPLREALLPKLAPIDNDLRNLRADLELKFSVLVNEIQKIGIRTELTAEKFKAETETYAHRSIAPLAERVAVLEMSFRNLKEDLEQAS